MSVRPRAWLLAGVSLLLSVVAAGEAGGAAAGMGHNVSERFMANLDERAARLAEAVDAGARELMAAQSDARRAGDIAMIVAVFHHVGVFGETDMEKAREFAEMALARGVIEAEVVLAGLLVDFADSGAVAEDRALAEAVAHLERGAAAGLPDAMRLLGLLYAEGIGGMAVDAAKAEEYFLAAARHGDPEALMRLEPVFQIAAAGKREHPELPSRLPTSAAEAVDSALVAAYERRQEELAEASALVEKALAAWLAVAEGGEKL